MVKIANVPNASRPAAPAQRDELLAAIEQDIAAVLLRCEVKLRAMERKYPPMKARYRAALAALQKRTP